MWFYFAITAPLMIATLLGWYWWGLTLRRKTKADDNGRGVDLEMGKEG